MTRRVEVRPSSTVIGLQDIREAASRLEGAIMRTPFLPSETLSAATGCSLHLKFENLQFTASFKERGALNKLLTLDASARRSGVCAMSAGNHAQGVAYHARRLDIPARIVMPCGTPLTKVSRTRDHGAEVVVAGANLSEAFEIAQRDAGELGLTFIHPYDDPLVMAGQGTVALEMLDIEPDLDILVVPIGGGGLIAGIAVAAKALRPDIEIVGVQSEVYPSMRRALAGDAAPCLDQLTIAEGIAVKVAGEVTRAVVGEWVDDILLVEEAFIERAIALLLSIEKTVVEGAGAAGLAAILQHPDRFRDRKVGTILSGGNIDLRMLAAVAMRELIRSDRLLRFEVPVSDRPGMLATMTGLIGERGGNIVEIVHDRLSLSLNPKGTMLDTVVEVENAAHGEALMADLEVAGFQVRRKSFG